MSTNVRTPHPHPHPHPHPAPHPGTHCTLDGALKTMVNIYHQFSPREGKDDYLSLRDLTELLQEQAPTFLEACCRDDPSYIPKLFKEADVKGSGHLTFEETIPIFNKIIDDFHRISHHEDRCGPETD